MPIDICPRCGAGLRGRKETWYTDVALGDDGKLVSARQREDAEEVWRIYCENGHEFSPNAWTLPGLPESQERQ